MQTQDLDRPTALETLSINGGQVIDAIKDLVHEGNVRRVSIKQDGHVIAEFPLTVGVVGAALAPAIAGIGAVAALLTDCTIEIQRDAPPAGVVDETTLTGVAS